MKHKVRISSIKCYPSSFVVSYDYDGKGESTTISTDGLLGVYTLKEWIEKIEDIFAAVGLAVDWNGKKREIETAISLRIK